MRITDGKKEKEVVELYRACRNKMEVARTMGMPYITVRNILKRKGVCEKMTPSDYVADKVIAKIQADPSIESSNMEYLMKAYGSSEVVEILRNPGKYDEFMRHQARVKLMMLNAGITLEKISEAPAGQLSQMIPIFADIASGKIKLGEHAEGKVNAGDIVDKLTLSIERIRKISPTLAKEAQEAVDGFLGKPKGKVIDVVGKDLRRQKAESKPGVVNDRINTGERK
jgi:hypothetical protein